MAGGEFLATEFYGHAASAGGTQTVQFQGNFSEATQPGVVIFDFVQSLQFPGGRMRGVLLRRVRRPFLNLRFEAAKEFRSDNFSGYL